MTTNITIIGAGNMGRGIAHVAARAGSAVTIVTRIPGEATALVGELQAAYPHATLKAASMDAPLTGDVVVLATWYTAAPEIAQQLRDGLTGKIVVDISNPLTADYSALAVSGTTSAAEDLARLIPGAHVVKAFNTTFAGTLVAGQVDGQPLDVLIASDDMAAKTVLVELVNAAGLRGIDVGPLERARQLEGLGFLGIQLQSPMETGFASSWKFLA